MKLVNLMLTVNEVIVAKAQKLYNSPKMVVDSLELMVNKIGHTLHMESRNFSINVQNVALSVFLPPTSDLNGVYVVVGRTRNESFAVFSSKLKLRLLLLIYAVIYFVM